MQKQGVIVETIRDLLTEYSYVSVPHLGGFVSKYQSAQIIAEKNIILPPSKQISFNAKLNTNDGLLVNALVKKENISIENAEQLIKTFVKDIFVSLDDGRKVTLEKLGVLRFNQQLNIEFVLEEKENFNPHSYGMIEQAFAPISSKELIEKKNRQFFSRKTLKYAAIILPFLILGTVLSAYLTNIGFFSTKPNRASFIPSIFEDNKDNKEQIKPSSLSISDQIDEKVKQKNALSYTEPTTDKTVEDKEIKETTDLNALNNSTPELNDKNIEANNEARTSKKINTAKLLKYQLVAGSFKSERNANKLLKKLEKLDVQAEIIKQGKRYRVIAASYANKNKAKKIKKRLKSKKISTWINTLK